jgi:outer membrane protein insertion porin family
MKKRIHIDEINFVGNEAVKDAKLRRIMKETKQRTFLISIFKPSKYIDEE